SSLMRPAYPRPPRLETATVLFLDGVADFRDGLADLAPDTARGFPGVSGGFVRDTFVMQSRVLRQIAGHLLDCALQSLCLACEFIAIHGCSSHVVTVTSINYV